MRVSVPYAYTDTVKTLNGRSVVPQHRAALLEHDIPQISSREAPVVASWDWHEILFDMRETSRVECRLHDGDHYFQVNPREPLTVGDVQLILDGYVPDGRVPQDTWSQIARHALHYPSYYYKECSARIQSEVRELMKPSREVLETNRFERMAAARQCMDDLAFIGGELWTRAKAPRIFVSYYSPTAVAIVGVRASPYVEGNWGVKYPLTRVGSPQGYEFPLSDLKGACRFATALRGDCQLEVEGLSTEVEDRFDPVASALTRQAAVTVSRHFHDIGSLPGSAVEAWVRLREALEQADGDGAGRIGIAMLDLQNALSSNGIADQLLDIALHEINIMERTLRGAAIGIPPEPDRRPG